MATEQTVAFLVTTRWVAGEDGEMSVEGIERIVREYLADDDCPFKDDYGQGAWGGYEGPFVTGVEVEVVPLTRNL